MITDKSEQLREEEERIKAKVSNYKAIIKVKENKIRELTGTQEQQQRKIGDLEDQCEKLIMALKKQKFAEERQLNDHFQHLQQKIEMLQQENFKFKSYSFSKQSANTRSNNALSSHTTLQFEHGQILPDKKRSKSPNTNVLSGQKMDDFSVALMQEINCENHH